VYRFLEEIFLENVSFNSVIFWSIKVFSVLYHHSHRTLHPTLVKIHLNTLRVASGNKPSTEIKSSENDALLSVKI
jgi:hypothetical protein